MPAPTFDHGIVSVLPIEEYKERGKQLGELIASKQTQYGNAVGKTDRILRVLYPNGIKPHQYGDVLLTVRVLDKLSRISQRGPDGRDLGGETPWKDIAGYGLLGWRQDEEGEP